MFKNKNYFVASTIYEDVSKTKKVSTFIQITKKIYYFPQKYNKLEPDASYSAIYRQNEVLFIYLGFVGENKILVKILDDKNGITEKEISYKYLNDIRKM